MFMSFWSNLFWDQFRTISDGLPGRFRAGGTGGGVLEGAATLEKGHCSLEGDEAEAPSARAGQWSQQRSERCERE